MKAAITGTAVGFDAFNTDTSVWTVALIVELVPTAFDSTDRLFTFAVGED